MAALVSSASLRVATWNVLLPNSVDGWWTFKNYCPATPSSAWTWESRQNLMSEKIREANPDVLALQEAGEKSYETDFSFLDDKYAYVVGDKGRMRCMTFYAKDRFSITSNTCKDRCLVTSLLDSSTDKTLWVVNVHLLTGQTNNGRRLRQVHECLRAVAKSKEPKDAVLVLGDFNTELSRESSLVKLLSDGAVAKGYVENGDAVTNKGKAQSLGRFGMVYDGSGKGEETLVAPQLVPRFWSAEGGLTPGLEAACGAVFNCYEEGGKWKEENLVEFLHDINLRDDRGSEMRFLRARMADNGELVEADVRDMYTEEVRGGKFWGVAHDLHVIGKKFDLQFPHAVLPDWYAGESRAPDGDDAEVFKAKFDHIFYLEAGLRVKEKKDMAGDDAQPMPNEAEPSDHKLLEVVFEFNG